MEKIFRNIFVVLSLSGLAAQADAVQVATQAGKITMAEGHFAPECRMVKHKETATGAVKTFRIKDVPSGHDDISSIAMAALVANRDVIIFYDPAVFTSCGSEPQVQVIDMF